MSTPDRSPKHTRCLVTAPLVVGFLAVAFAVGVSLGHPTGLSSATAPARGATAPPPPLEGSAAADPGQVFPTGSIDRGDPVLVSDGTRTYVYWTQPLPNLNVPVQSKATGGTWGPITDPLPTLPSWAAPGATWSPEVHQFGAQWVLYFSSLVVGVTPNTHCIGDAISSTPAGPFTPAAQPFICQTADAGSIDPRVFVAPDGTPYLVWKSDNNSELGHGEPLIWSQRLSTTGTALLGQPASIYAADLAWQDGLVEAPDLVFAQGRYWLFYSGGEGFFSADYAIGYAACSGPQGPCANQSTVPLLASNAQGHGPGEESVFVSGSADWLVYNPSCSVDTQSPRPTAIARLGFGSSGPYLAQT